MKNVSFLGYRALVPASWQVVNLAATPTACVRFDRHAIYLGAPEPPEYCPAHLVAAKTEALLVEPLSAPGGAAKAVADEVAHQYVITDAPAGVEITATYGGDQALIKRILASLRLGILHGSLGPVGHSGRSVAVTPERAPASASGNPPASFAESPAGRPAGSFPTNPPANAAAGRSSFRPASPSSGFAESPPAGPADPPSASSPASTPTLNRSASQSPSTPGSVVTLRSRAGASQAPLTPPRYVTTLRAQARPTRSPPAPVPPSPWLPTPPSPAALPASVTNDTGLGFDACTAPGPATMSAWMSQSPYRAIGIYIGGSDRACAQPNLTAAWVSEQAAAGWHFIPLYVGPQAEWHQITAAVSQGVSAADDAISQAQSLGFGPGTPLYYDMEAYPRRQRGAALRFLCAWSEELHINGYASGVYSSSNSAVTDLADLADSGYPGSFSYPGSGYLGYTGHPGHYGYNYLMPDVIFDGLWNGEANTADARIPSDDWVYHQRIHQFTGPTSQTYGGHRLNIDRDYLDVMLPPGGQLQAGRPAPSAGAMPDGVTAPSGKPELSGGPKLSGAPGRAVSQDQRTHPAHERSRHVQETHHPRHEPSRHVHKPHYPRHRRNHPAYR